jgi:hypothetical protein
MKIIYLSPLLLLTGCIGSMISGDTGYMCEEFPDIRTVPERVKACEPRGTHKGVEKECRSTDFKKLEEDREKIKARDQALREQ